jgi:uncharacterized membrane protein YdjX (TVP38/TMEM64 family)
MGVEGNVMKEDAPYNDGEGGVWGMNLLLRLLPFIIAPAGLAAFFLLGLDDYLSFDTFSDYREEVLSWRDQHYALAICVFVLAYALMVTFCIPFGVWMTIAGGFLFGVGFGMALVMAGATAGAISIFLAARYMVGDFLRAKAGLAIRRMEAGFRENAFSYLMVLRLLPVFPFWLVNLVPAFLGVPLRTYAAATFIGIIPGSFVYCGVGNGLGAVIDAGEIPDLGIVFKAEILLPILGLALLSLTPIACKWFKRDRS